LVGAAGVGVWVGVAVAAGCVGVGVAVAVGTAVGVAVGAAVAGILVVGVAVGVELELELYTSTPSMKTEPLQVTPLAGGSHTPTQRAGVTTPLGTTKLRRFHVPGERLIVGALYHVLFAS
jgi:hypothetical protein